MLSTHEIVNLFGEPDGDELGRDTPTTLEDEIAARTCLVCGGSLIVISRPSDWCLCRDCGTRMGLTMPMRAATKAEERFRDRKPRRFRP